MRSQLIFRVVIAIAAAVLFAMSGKAPPKAAGPAAVAAAGDASR